MKNLPRIIAVVIFSSSMALAQNQETDVLSQVQIKKLGFIVGNWKGSGWMYGQDRQRHTFEQTEKISFKLDSTAILIEGMGRSSGKVIHNAMAIVSFDKAKNHYSFYSYLASGMKNDFKAELIDGTLFWYPNENMRYIISIDDSGQWYEKGEINQGGNWFQFFEMTLNKTE